MGRDESKRDRRFPLLSTRFGFLEICATDSRHYREIQFLWKQFPPRLPASRISSRGEKFVNKAPDGRRRRRRRRSIHTRYIPAVTSRFISFLLAPSLPRLVSFFVCSLFFFPSFFFLFSSSFSLLPRFSLRRAFEPPARSSVSEKLR